MSEREREPWHLDKRVPIALIVSIMMQTLGAVWWAANMSARINDHDRRLTTLTDSIISTGTEARRLNEMLARIDERTSTHSDLLRRMQASFEQQQQQQRLNGRTP